MHDATHCYGVICAYTDHTRPILRGFVGGGEPRPYNVVRRGMMGGGEPRPYGTSNILSPYLHLLI